MKIHGGKVMIRKSGRSKKGVLARRDGIVWRMLKSVIVASQVRFGPWSGIVRRAMRGWFLGDGRGGRVLVVRSLRMVWRGPS